MSLSKSFKFLFGWLRGRDGVMALATLATLLWFVVDWCLSTTFRSMSDWLLYAVNISAALVLLVPWMLSRRVWIQLMFLGLLDILLEANLMYCRTYFTAIPPDSYFLVGNMADFTASIFDSFRLPDVGFPVILILFAMWTSRSRTHEYERRIVRWLSLTLLMITVSVIGITVRGGFYKAYDRLIQDCYYFTCGVPTYTVGGHIAYYLIENRRNANIGEKELADVDDWLAMHRANGTAPDSIPARRSIVFIICESLESWPIGAEINGKEITPYLNSLVADSTTFYAPKVLTQVCAGHSIDGQLMYTTGLLPTAGFVYSMKYPDNEYPSLNKILKADRGARSTLLTSDKLFTWNQGAIANAFGYDSIEAHDSWIRDEIVNGKLSDGSLFRQIVDKLSKGDIWPEDTAAMLTIVTMTGHNPFVLTPELSDPDFDASQINISKSLSNYINVTHYVDSQLHTIVDYLQNRTDSSDILIVIVGDHEGLGMERKYSRDYSPEGKALVDEGKYVPMIVLNSPVGGRYESVMGQIDVFPTVLDLLGLQHSEWRGIGASVLSDDKVPVAFSMIPFEFFGDTTNVAPAVMQHLKRAPEISERIIIYDLIKQ